MKLTPVQVEAMRERIAPLDTAERRQAYREGRFPRAEAVKDLDMRYRWDLYHAARVREVLDRNIGGDGADLTDAHIDTGLRRIVPALGQG
jgi:hypothetical protein